MDSAPGGVAMGVVWERECWWRVLALVLRREVLMDIGLDTHFIYSHIHTRSNAQTVASKWLTYNLQNMWQRLSTLYMCYRMLSRTPYRMKTRGSVTV